MPAKRTPKPPQTENHYHEDYRVWISSEAVTDRIKALLKDPFFHDLMFYVAEVYRPSSDELLNAPAETVARKAVGHAAVMEVIPRIKSLLVRTAIRQQVEPWSHVQPQP